MRHGAFEALVTRCLGNRSRRAVLLDAGLPLSALKNMRDRPTMPSASQIGVMAVVLDAHAADLTRALLQDRGYDLGGGTALSALAAVTAGMTAKELAAVQRVAEVLVDLRDDPDQD